jgi:outer membrane cobalamin receptor
MGTVTTPPDEQARSIFDDLGYSLAGDGAEFSATRDWKEIRVCAVTDDVDAREDDSYRCFVTWADHADALEAELERLDPSYEWAVMGVREDGDYEVARAPPA